MLVHLVQQAHAVVALAQRRYELQLLQGEHLRAGRRRQQEQQGILSQQCWETPSEPLPLETLKHIHHATPHHHHVRHPPTTF